MKKYIALLRGINVSGHKIIKMEDLRQKMERSGFESVKTYIQSGNIVFKSKSSSAEWVQKSIVSLIKKDYGFDVGVIILDESDIEKAIANNPYSHEKESGTKRIYVVFLSAVPSAENVALLDVQKFAPDEFEVVGSNIYIRFANSASDSKFTNTYIESRLKVVSTTRNWNTTLKLQEMITAMD